MRLVKSLVLIGSAVLLVTSAGTAFTQTAQKTVTIQGQLVCSECWFEADRTTTPYGNDADIQCAKDCAVKGVPPAVSVKNGDDFTLYLLETGRFNQPKDEWLKYVGRWVRVSGRTTIRSNRHYLAVDDFEISNQPEDNSVQRPPVGAEAELGLKDLFGVDQKLSAYRGKIVVLNFWATWCIPCRKEMPDLAAVQNEFAALGVQVVAATANTLSERNEVLKFVRETQINFPIWLGAETDDMKRFGLGPSLPATAIIGRDGRIVWASATVVSQAELRKVIDRLLAIDAATLHSDGSSVKTIARDASLVPS
jgi:thiol-disulfide isomerase/thioredoxin